MTQLTYCSLLVLLVSASTLAQQVDSEEAIQALKGQFRKVTRMLGTVTKTTLGKQLAEKYINSIPCTESIDEAQLALDGISEGIERAKPQLNVVLTLVKGMSEEKNPAAIVSMAGLVLRQMDDLIKNIIPQGADAPLACEATASETAEGVIKIADLLKTLGGSPKLIRSVTARESLGKSEKVIRATAKLIVSFSDTAESFNFVCSDDPEYAQIAFGAVADGVDKIGDLFAGLDDKDNSDIIKKAAKNIKDTSVTVLNLAAQSPSLPASVTSIDCEASFQDMADALEDLSVRLEELQK